MEGEVKGVCTTGYRHFKTFTSELSHPTNNDANNALLLLQIIQSEYRHCSPNIRFDS